MQLGGGSLLNLRSIAISALFLLCAGCGRDPRPDASLDPDPIASLLADAEEKTQFHQIDLALTTQLTSGRIRVYLLIYDELKPLEERLFDQPDPTIHVAYSAPMSVPNSWLAIHIVPYGPTEGSPEEYVCLAQINHDTTRHGQSVRCDLFSTIAYYLSGDRVARTEDHPFIDLASRAAAWKSVLDSPANDVVGFYSSVFGTLQNALVAMGRNHFDPDRFSIRPVMETIVAQSIDTYQRQGQLSASQLVDIANFVTDSSLPLERLIRFQTVFDQYSYIEDVPLSNTGGSLTDRSSKRELLSMSSEVRRFFLRDSPFEMSDYRTHIVQNIHQKPSQHGYQLQWDPIPHMYGYNVYLDGQHIGYSRLPQIHISAPPGSDVTIKAVGYAGEFDGVHHELADAPILAGVENVAK